jgi:hypothetical protein
MQYNMLAEGGEGWQEDGRAGRRSGGLAGGQFEQESAFFKNHNVLNLIIIVYFFMNKF